MAASYIASAEEDLTCPLCLELFVDPDHTPKELNCPHVYCYSCLVKMVEGGRPTITCPECRVVTRVPPKTPKSEGGIPVLKTNLRIRSLAQKHLKHTAKHSSPTQRPAEKSDDIPTCPNPKHNGEKMHFHCVTCNVAACRICFVSNHPQPEHLIKDLEEVCAEKRKSMNALVSESIELASTYEKQANNAARLEEELLKVISGEEQKIDKAVAEATRNIQDRGQALKAELQSIHNLELQMYNDQKQTLSKTAHDVRNVVTDTKTALENATSYEYLNQHELLKEKLIKSAHLKRGIGTVRNNHNIGTFEAIEEPMNLGRIMHRKLPLDLELVETLKLPEYVNSIAAGSGIDGSTLAIGLESALHIYNKMQTANRYVKEISFAYAQSEDQHIKGVAVLPNGKYLVAKEQVVEVYNTSGEREAAIYTREDKKTKHVCLCSVVTTPQGLILIGDSYNSVITVHTAEGLLKNTISICDWHHQYGDFNIVFIKDTYVAIQTYGSNSRVNVIDWETKKMRVDLRSALNNELAACYDEMSDCLLIRNTEPVMEGSFIKRYIKGFFVDYQDMDMNFVFSRMIFGRHPIWQYCLSTGRLEKCRAEGFGYARTMTILNGMLVVADRNTVKIYKII